VNGITHSGITKCSHPSCDNEYVRQTVRDKYCAEHRGRGNRYHSARAARNAEHNVNFIMVDGEGTGDGRNHKYVLLGVGDRQLERPDGFKDIREIFGFLYEQFQANPDASFCGYYLGYDFNMWLRLLPRDRAFYLLTEIGRRKRQRVCKCPKNSRCGHKRLPPHPVEYGGWQFDILGYKRLKLRPKTCSCRDATCHCPGQAKWMYVNDSGPFFQSSLMVAINPARWPEPIVTPGEYGTLLEGKELRGAALLDDDMRRYNRLENEVGARLLSQLNRGFTSAGIRLTKKQWFGPGQAAQAWMRLEGKLETTTEAVRKYPQALKDALIATYYGGWFEITCHGIIGGITHEYDINSAYPAIASRMPCMCGKWTHSEDWPTGGLRHGWLYGDNPTSLRLCNVGIMGHDPYLGGLPYRSRQGHVLHPRYTRGWYWQHEIDAARKAGLISSVTYFDTWTYQPCKHRQPLRALAGLYEGRQRVGKDTPEGKAYKLVYNSVYGKLAQSLGDPAYANPVYASLITSGCRTMILNAIASHPDKARAVAMIATDGVYFMSPHPGLDIGDGMGQWSHDEKHDLTLFKPGVYWDNHSRELINAGKAPKFKARGINAADFARSIADVDAMFDSWTVEDAPRVSWPVVSFRSRFSQVSVLQALQWTAGVKQPGKQEGKYRALAGQVSNGKELEQRAEPEAKRNAATLAYDASVGVWRTKPWDMRNQPPSTPYERRFGLDIEGSDWDEYATPDGSVMLSFREALLAG
jgi:hypothetical protein